MNDISDINEFIRKLYQFVTKLIKLIEEELNDIEAMGASSTINKKAITDSLTKIVALVKHLKTLSIETNYNEEETIPERDKTIIENFLKNISK